MGQLDAHGHVGGELASAAEFVVQCGSGAVVPQPQAQGRDASLGDDRRGLDDEQGRPTIEQAAPVHEVPVGGLPVVCRILAHGRHDCAVGQWQGASR